ncbi:MAG: protoporphyrinogen oxidase HemJ [Rhodospirillaceae bacterium]
MLFFWIKALHIISVIAWMAGLLYLPRLFVNHVGLAPGSQASEMLKGMEQRLLRIIMRPAAAATVIFGIAILFLPQSPVDWSQAWIYVKLAFVAGLGFMHGRMERWTKDFAADANTRSARYYRIANELPAVFMIGIVIMVVLKPF